MSFQIQVYREEKMPEFYAEPMKDRKCCSVCKKTAKEKGKKVLLTCVKCHAITYCGVECQREDWERHEWNCVPVMVTEIPGKGRGLVAATDIEKGELIFQDKPAIIVWPRASWARSFSCSRHRAGRAGRPPARVSMLVLC